jgi:hypothetical protein
MAPESNTAAGIASHIGSCSPAPKTKADFDYTLPLTDLASGLYRIKSVKSKFHEGVFTQDLDLFRDRGQQPQEIANVRADPSLIAGSALITDPRQRTFSSVVPTAPPVALDPPAETPVAVSSPVAPQSTLLDLQPASLKATIDPEDSIRRQRQLDKDRIDSQ